MTDDILLQQPIESNLKSAQFGFVQVGICGEGWSGGENTIIATAFRLRHPYLSDDLNSESNSARSALTEMIRSVR